MTELSPAVGVPVSELCGASRNQDGQPPWCGEPAAMLARAMCVHEHYGEVPVCWGCMAELEVANDLWECIPCAEGPDPHGCLMPNVFVPLDGAACLT